MKRLNRSVVVLLCALGCVGVAIADNNGDLLSADSRSKLDFAVKALKNNYYTEVDEKTIVENMLSGMLTKMDPHSCYLAKDEMHDFESETNGQFGGIGIEIMPDKGLILIVTPLDDTPAARAGIKAGDKIIQIDETLVHDLSTKKAVELMRGEPGTTVKLVISPKDGGGPVVKELTREMINVKSVRYRMLEPGYGYIRVTFFQANTGKELRQALAALIKQAATNEDNQEKESDSSLVSRIVDKWRDLVGDSSKSQTVKGAKGVAQAGKSGVSGEEDNKKQDEVAAASPKNQELQGIVLDLRNNPGGLLDTGIQVADTFLDAAKMGDNKRIVYTESRTSDSKFVVHATVGDLLKGKPLVVLINEGSASAAEIVAGALQDHHRAVVVGKRSFGKGSVQSLIPLSDGSGIKVTTAVYYTPGGTSLQAQGVVPDVEIEDITVDPKAVSKSVINIAESSLADHIEVTKKSDGERKSLRDPDPVGEELLYKDYPLYEALQILKAGSAFTNKHPDLVMPVESTSSGKAVVDSGLSDGSKPGESSIEKTEDGVDGKRELPENINSGVLAPIEFDKDLGLSSGSRPLGSSMLMEEPEPIDLDSILNNN